MSVIVGMLKEKVAEEFWGRKSKKEEVKEGILGGGRSVGGGSQGRNVGEEGSRKGCWGGSRGREEVKERMLGEEVKKGVLREEVEEGMLREQVEEGMFGEEVQEEMLGSESRKECSRKSLDECSTK